MPRILVLYTCSRVRREAQMKNDIMQGTDNIIIQGRDNIMIIHTKRRENNDNTRTTIIYS